MRSPRASGVERPLQVHPNGKARRINDGSCVHRSATMTHVYNLFLGCFPILHIASLHFFFTTWNICVKWIIFINIILRLKTHPPSLNKSALRRNLANLSLDTLSALALIPFISLPPFRFSHLRVSRSSLHPLYANHSRCIYIAQEINRRYATSLLSFPLLKLTVSSVGFNWRDTTQLVKAVWFSCVF